MEPNRGRLRIAIVDDDPLVRRALTRLVSSQDIDAETYDSGCEFIEMLEQTRSFTPDCVILDNEIPGYNGLQVQKYLASRPRRIPVILLTGTHGGLIRDEALACRVFTLIEKPVDPDLLIGTLLAVLNVQGSD
jgi:two-component system, LuxR family, response regulator FixJ